jgi:hypothetical protein
VKAAQVVAAAARAAVVVTAAVAVKMRVARMERKLPAKNSVASKNNANLLYVRCTYRVYMPIINNYM